VKRLLVGVVAIFLLGAGPVSAQSMNIGKAKFLSAIHVKGGQASLKVRYKCAEGTHIWVSAKQTANGKKDAALKGEGSSRLAATWWQSHRDYYRCDNHTNTSIFYIDKLEEGSKGKLRKGVAWVQFCVTTGETPADSKLIVVKVGWVRVKK
jgi:hypothetical protein